MSDDRRDLTRGDILPPSLDDIEALARAALQTIPAVLRQRTGDVIIRIDDFVDEEMEIALGLETPYDLLGLYQGVSLERKSVSDPQPEADMIFLYRRPILDYWCDSGEDLAHIVRHVLIHEIGHHFGLSDDDMDRLERMT